MSTSARELKNNLLYNLAGAAFLGVFGAIYEHFSHGVYSPFMVFAFAVPLLLGVLVYGVLLIAKKYPGRAAVLLWNSGIAALSVGSVFKGVLDIYGTTNPLIVVYPVAGGILLLAAVAAAAILRKTGGRGEGGLTGGVRASTHV